ncbi:MAG: hypothetical protein J5658_12815 [Prevotella sp.]|nr:hypothetical protein [Prevotella sp.]
MLSLTVTCAWADAVTDALKTNLGKIVAIADLLGENTQNAKALIANSAATQEDLQNEILSLSGKTTTKANEVLGLAESFFERFDPETYAILEPSFSTTKNIVNNSSDIDEITTAIQALAAQVLDKGKTAMGKVDTYIRKMENETINTDLDKFQAAIAANNLNDAMAALRDLKSHVKDAGMSYLTQVQALIEEGEAAGNDVSGVEEAKGDAVNAALYYQLGSATVIDLGEALLNLIKAVDAYEAANPEVPTGINGITAEQMDNIYNLNGQRVQKAQKGLYIINGKKVLVK